MWDGSGHIGPKESVVYRDTPRDDTNKSSKIEQINVSENDIMLDLSKLSKGTKIRLVFGQGEISLRI